MSAKEKARAIRKLEIAIDKLIEVQDLGGGCDAIARALEILNAHLNRLRG